MRQDVEHDERAQAVADDGDLALESLIPGINEKC